MCQVAPDNIPILTAFGWLFVAGGVLSLLTGQTYFRGLVARDDAPLDFWSTVIGMLTIGGLSLLGVAVCPSG